MSNSDSGTPLELIEELLKVYWPVAFPGVPSDNPESAHKARNAIGRCLAYHIGRYHEAGYYHDYGMVASELQAGRSAGGSLHANVISDVVLAHGVLVHEDRALKRFLANYDIGAEALVAGFTHRVEGLKAGRVTEFRYEDSGEWPGLVMFITELRSGGEGSARLERYDGRSGLWPFLKASVLFAMIDWKRRLERRLSTEVVFGETCKYPVCDYVATIEQRLTGDPAHLRAFRMVHREGKTCEEVGLMLGIHKGNVSRRLNKLKAEFDQSFSAGLADDGKTARLVAGCLELAGNPLPLTIYITCRDSCGDHLA